MIAGLKMRNAALLKHLRLQKEMDLLIPRSQMGDLKKDFQQRRNSKARKLRSMNEHALVSRMSVQGVRKKPRGHHALNKKKLDLREQ